MSNARRPLGLEPQALLSAVETSLDDYEQDKLTQLLMQHQDIFATKGEPPGHSDLVQQHCEYDNTPPPPIHQKEQAQAEVDRMLAQDIKEP